jgi:2-polyprenyl-3-methyl-5-hydroxy-6-metoxy-1,4-benzoquinol methylase
MKNKCIVCGFEKFSTIWNEKIRNSSISFTKTKKKILKCQKCELIFLKDKKKHLENSSYARKIYNKDNSIKEFIKFHKPRELKKIKFLSNLINIKGKNILELNCGAGVILSHFQNMSKSTTGVDDVAYKDYLNSKGHNHFQNINQILKKNFTYDCIFSMSELEHKFDPKAYLLKVNRLMKKSSKLIIRVPNFQNIYMHLLGKSFLKYDYRTSHNFYFSRQNLDLLFKKSNFNIEKILGFHEYSINHLLEFLKTKKRVYGKAKKFFSDKDNYFAIKNIEDKLVSTSLIYILKKK